MEAVHIVSIAKRTNISATSNDPTARGLTFAAAKGARWVLLQKRLALRSRLTSELNEIGKVNQGLEILSFRVEVVAQGESGDGGACISNVELIVSSVPPSTLLASVMGRRNLLRRNKCIAPCEALGKMVLISGELVGGEEHTCQVGIDEDRRGVR